MNIKKIDYYLKKNGLEKNKNNYKNIINIYKHTNKIYNYELTKGEEILLTFYYMLIFHKIRLGVFILIEIFLLVISLNLIFNHSFRIEIEERIRMFYQNYIQTYHSNLGIEMKIWRKIQPLYLDRIRDIMLNLDVNLVRTGIVRKIQHLLGKDIIDKNYINRFLPIIIENFKNKIKLRREIINVSREELIKKTKISEDVINKILSFVDKIVK